jgi:hypothetical protein
MFAVVGALSPAVAAAAPTADSAGRAEREDKPPAGAKASPARTGKSEGTAATNGPPDAAAALVRAAAAYEYGDLNQVVESARYITEGSLPATPEQQTQAFRLLGIGLYLTNRPLGAEAAFAELLRKDPRARLDPTTTRPELVAFFESLRRQHLVKERSTRKMIWNFIPPGGQFQNGDDTKGWIILGAGLLSGATCATTYILHETWALPADQSKHGDAATTMKTVNIVSGTVVIAIYLYGVVDGLVGYSRPLDDSRPPVSLHFFPGGGGLGFTF